jgi:DNA-binding response OmpR family regulator
MEFDLLKAFVERPNQVLNRDQLLTLTRDRELGAIRSLDRHPHRTHTAQMRPTPRSAGDRTVRGAGYMFVPSPDTE